MQVLVDPLPLEVRLVGGLLRNSALVPTEGFELVAHKSSDLPACAGQFTQQIVKMRVHTSFSGSFSKSCPWKRSLLLSDATRTFGPFIVVQLQCGPTTLDVSTDELGAAMRTAIPDEILSHHEDCELILGHVQQRHLLQSVCLKRRF